MDQRLPMQPDGRPPPRVYPELTPQLGDAWRAVMPSHCGRLEYRPCSVHLADGSTEDCVYVMHAQMYISQWGVWPDQDSWKQNVPIERVVSLRESPYRLPAHIADQIYGFGETGMGYIAFTLIFADGTTAKYAPGDAVDFVELPEGKSASEIVSVEPHGGGPVCPTNRGIRYAWCLFGRADDVR